MNPSSLEIDFSAVFASSLLSVRRTLLKIFKYRFYTDETCIYWNIPATGMWYWYIHYESVQIHGNKYRNIKGFDWWIYCSH